MSEKCFIYARKSVDTGKGESIENQIEMCKDYFKGKPDIEFRIYHDKGFSGKNTNRPHFQQMRTDIKVEKPQYLICYRLDRISRSVGDFAEFYDFLQSCGTTFISITEKFDTSSSVGKAMLSITAVFAQLERETIAERVRDNMYLLARTGRWLGGTPPLGYKIDQKSEMIFDGKVSTVSSLAINNEEIEDIVRNNEPHLALFAGVDGLDCYRNILNNVKEHLKEKYLIAFEIGYTQANDIKALAQQVLPKATIEVKKDLSEKDRMIFIYN